MNGFLIIMLDKKIWWGNDAYKPQKSAHTYFLD